MIKASPSQPGPPGSPPLKKHTPHRSPFLAGLTAAAVLFGAAAIARGAPQIGPGSGDGGDGQGGGSVSVEVSPNPVIVGYEIQLTADATTENLDEGSQFSGCPGVPAPTLALDEPPAALSATACITRLGTQVFGYSARFDNGDVVSARDTLTVQGPNGSEVQGYRDVSVMDGAVARANLMITPVRDGTPLGPCVEVVRVELKSSRIDESTGAEVLVSDWSEAPNVVYWSPATRSVIHRVPVSCESIDGVDESENNGLFGWKKIFHYRIVIPRYCEEENAVINIAGPVRAQLRKVGPCEFEIVDWFDYDPPTPTG